MFQIDWSLVQLAVFGFFTGLGSTFGGEVAKDLMQRYRSTHKKITETLVKSSRSA